MAKKKTVILPNQLEVGESVAVLYWKDSIGYWIKGYRVADPESTVRRPGWIAVVSTDKYSRPVLKKVEDVEKIRAGKRYYSFGEVYGTAIATGKAIAS